jgi:hypothetical protein
VDRPGIKLGPEQCNCCGYMQPKWKWWQNSLVKLRRFKCITGQCVCVCVCVCVWNLA